MVQPKVDQVDIVEFCESLASMIGSGLPLLESMESIRDTIKKKRLKNALDRVIREIAGGESLSGAFSLEPDVFPEMLVFFLQHRRRNRDHPGCPEKYRRPPQANG